MIGTDKHDIEAAKVAAAAAEEAVAAASASVDSAREQYAVGAIRRGELQTIRNQLAKAIESAEQAKSKVRVLERRAAEDQRAAAAARREWDQAQRKRFREERKEVLASVVELLDGIERQVVRVDSLVYTFNARANGDRVTGLLLPRPSDMGRPWGQFVDGIRTFQRLFRDIAP
jgi:hypothetical protein